jgi:hypothetical protein
MFDPANCNACGTVCPTRPNSRPACGGGTCGIICNAGFGNCDGIDANGCETDLATSATHCGVCGNTCLAGVTCVTGMCGYPPRYTESTPASAPAFIDACAAPGVQVFLNNTDDNFVSQALPFAFPYWGTLLPAGATIYLSSNGNIQLAGPGSAIYYNTVIPQADGINGTVAVRWADVYTRTPGLCAVTLGSAPNRQYVVEWQDAAYCCDNSAGGAHENYEVVLRETSGIIDMIYAAMSGGRAMTAGLENADSTQAIRPTHATCSAATSNNCVPVAGTVYRFTPSL